MNDRVEEIYTQMFAPQPIPQSVLELFDRTNFLANRIDCQLTVGALVLIAALATKSAATAVSKLVEPEVVDTNEVNETLKPQTDVVTSNDTDVAPQTAAETTNQAAALLGPLGPMDAPQGEATESGKNSLAASLNLMSKAELTTHAKDVCGITSNQLYGVKQGRVSKRIIQRTSKAKIIKIILGKTG